MTGRGHVPTRTCVGCRTRRPQGELVRLVRGKAGDVVVDAPGRLEGRGVYLCSKEECWALARRRKSLERALSVSLDGAAWQNLVSSRPASTEVGS